MGYTATKRQEAPLTAQIELTGRCNHSCQHCYMAGNYGNNLEGILDENKLLSELRAHNFKRLILTGGEPFTVKDTLFRLLSQTPDFDVSINSNGTSIEEADIERLVSYSQLNGFFVTLFSHMPKTHDSITGVKESYVRLIKNIKLMSETGLYVVPNILLRRDNFKDFEKTLIYVAEELYLKKAVVSKVILTKNTESLELKDEELIESSNIMLRQNGRLHLSFSDPIPYCFFGNKIGIYKQFLNVGCNAGKSQIAIAPNGDIRPCTHFSLIFGNIYHDGLKEAWERMTIFRNGSLTPDACKPCEGVKYCHYGCRSAGFNKHGELNGADPLIKGCDFYYKAAGSKK
ncbi:MAG: radical SAM protein [Nanoarchaeota archaeon]|nr:radical SAM protein [Nanoarchaeota archaeon]